MSPLDIIVGLGIAKPLVYLFAKALVYYQNKEDAFTFNEVFDQILKEDEESFGLFEKLEADLPLSKDSVHHKIRCILLVLDHEVSHDLIKILTGIDSRGIYVTAQIVTKEIGAIIFHLDDLSEIEEGYLAIFLNEEILNIKTSIKKYF